MSESDVLKWLLPNVLLNVHAAQLDEHGGLTGIRDEGALSSALNRPQNHFGYGETNVFMLAALYAVGIIKNHPFVDGNKRTGFLAAFIFLDVNGYNLITLEADAVLMTQRLAASDIDEVQFAFWLEQNAKPNSTA